MQGKIQVAPGADMNALMNTRHTLGYKLGQLLEERFNIENNARAYQVVRVGVNQARWQEMEAIGLATGSEESDS